MRRQSLFLWAAGALLSACGQQPANNTAQSAPGATSGSESEDPADLNRVDPLVYPGSQRDGDRYSTSDPMDRVIAWYWDEERPLQERDGLLWGVSKPSRRSDGGYLVGVNLSRGEFGRSFYIYLDERDGGGTDARIRMITDEEMKSGFKL